MDINDRLTMSKFVLKCSDSMNFSSFEFSALMRAARPGGPAGLGVGARSLNQYGMVTVYPGCSTGVKSLKFRSSAPIRSLVAGFAADRLLYTALTHTESSGNL